MPQWRSAMQATATSTAAAELQLLSFERDDAVVRTQKLVLLQGSSFFELGVAEM